MSPFRPCIIIPFYNHGGSIAAMIEQLRPLRLRCYLVNDASDRECEPILDQLARSESEWLQLISYQPNQGKGQAVMVGVEAALSDGYSHAVQIDADGQHRVADLRRLLEHATAHPSAVIAGYAVYDDSVPAARRIGRHLTHLWVWINSLSTDIRDSMCGLRVYPLAATLDTWRLANRHWFSRIGRRMSFDIEILVRMYWRGVKVINIPVAVTYPTDGVSHFRLWRDNAHISMAHSRLFLGMLWRSPRLLTRRWRRDAT